MKQDIIKAVVSRPHSVPIVTTIKNDLETFQKLVDGYIEVVPLQADSKVMLVLNEEGKFKGLEPNFFWYEDLIVGTVVFVGFDEESEDGDFISLTDEQLEEISDYLDLDEGELE
jgi:hypothetical protein